MHRAVMPPQLRGLRAAFVFLTRIPVGGFPFRDADFKWATAYFPVVGAALGLLQAGLFVVLPDFGQPASLSLVVKSALVVAFSLLLTGAFHEDGLADTADALGGAYDRARLFVILKDSRVGTFGASALMLVLLLRVLLIAAAPLPAVCIVVSQSLSRVAPIWLMATQPYVSGSAQAKSAQVTLGGAAQAAAATLFGLAVLYASCCFGGLRWQAIGLSLLLLLCVTVLLVYRFRKRAGGVTGDFLGATQQLGEIALLLGLTTASTT